MCIRYSWSEKRLKKIEKVMDSMIILSFLSAILPLTDGSYNTSTATCWIQVSFKLMGSILVYVKDHNVLFVFLSELPHQL